MCHTVTLDLPGSWETSCVKLTDFIQRKNKLLIFMTGSTSGVRGLAGAFSSLIVIFQRHSFQVLEKDMPEF